MSGSFDRPPPGGSLPPPQDPRNRLRREGWTGPNTGIARPHQPAYPEHTPYNTPISDPRPTSSPPHAEFDYPPGDPDRTQRPVSGGAGPYAPGDSGLRAESRQPARSSPQVGQAPIVPASSVTSNSLTLVISIMCFLACLTAGAVYMIHQAASAWLHDIASEITVQIEPRDKVDTDRIVKDVTTFLAKQNGVRTVRPLSLDDSASLIEPWLGSSEGLKALPVPRLVAIEVDRAKPPDIVALRRDLIAQFPKGVVLDDHRHWQQQIRTVTRSLALGGIAILILVAAATIAIIVSAARSAMASNREIIEVLHFVGATDRFIAGEFERHFQRLGVRAGLVGAVSAMLVFLLMPSFMELLGGGAVTMAELQRLIGTGTLDAMGYGVLVIVVFVIATLCRLTSRFGVFRILNSQH